MQPDRTRCSECGGEMQPGYIPDLTYGAILNQRWFPGAARKHWLTGLKVDWSACRSVETDRCKNCGFLKFYANTMSGSPGRGG
jgi:hypothetical protein